MLWLRSCGKVLLLVKKRACCGAQQVQILTNLQFRSWNYEFRVVGDTGVSGLCLLILTEHR
ncbi:hypothetical protein KL86CIT2_580019 [uncultured Citrobacter sp.]|uniref:Uncharacterized protein n=1 Tax=uncultured Citrobacter sp. TaxID=200446 RepID=A0A212IN28_9ENTR|nr:hypothetical protein KL86CIT2_580019 [uncultured Citrobacter sp.]